MKKYKHATDYWLNERLTAKKKYRDNARSAIEKLIGKIKKHDELILDLEHEIRRRKNTQE